MLCVCWSVEMEQDFMYVRTGLDNLHSWHNYLLGDGGIVRKSSFYYEMRLFGSSFFFFLEVLCY